MIRILQKRVRSLDISLLRGCAITTLTLQHSDMSCSVFQEVEEHGNMTEEMFARALGVGGAGRIDLGRRRIKILWSFVDKNQIGLVDSRYFSCRCCLLCIDVAHGVYLTINFHLLTSVFLHPWNFHDLVSNSLS